MAGRLKQLKGKVNDVVGAARGNTAQQVKGKVQKAVGKVQTEMSKSERQASRDRARARAEGI